MNKYVVHIKEKVKNTIDSHFTLALFVCYNRTDSKRISSQLTWNGASLWSWESKKEDLQTHAFF